MMDCYRFADCNVLSDIEVSPFRLTGSFDPELRIRAVEPANPPASRNWIDLIAYSDGRPWLRVAETAGGLAFLFPDRLLARYHESGSILDYCALDDAPGATIAYLIENQVLPFVLSRMGRSVLHATALAAQGSCAAFTGPSGCGKSTLAASLSGARGYEPVADDCLVLGRRDGVVHGYPATRGFRLWPESAASLGPSFHDIGPTASYSTKVRVGRGNAAPATAECLPAPMSVIYVLDPGPPPAEAAEIVIESVPGRERPLSLMANSYRLPFDDASRLAREFREWSEIAAGVPIRRIRFRRGWDRLDRVTAAIARDLERREDR